MRRFDPLAVLALAARPQDLPLTPAVRRRVRRVEIRLDLVDESDWAHRVREVERAFPAARFLATLRLDRDGGRWPDAKPRLEAMERILSISGWDAVDIESDSVEFEALTDLARRVSPGIRLVVSRHNFIPVDTPEMETQVGIVREKAREVGGAVAKWAGRLLDIAESGPELVRLLSGWSDAAQPAIFPMGPGSEPWRVACSAVSGGWGYGHDGTGAVAPGMVPWKVFDALLGSVPGSDRWNQAWFSGIETATALALREEVAA